MTEMITLCGTFIGWSVNGHDKSAIIEMPIEKAYEIIQHSILEVETPKKRRGRKPKTK